MTEQEAFLSDVDLFLEKSGMRPTRLGLLAVNDKHLVRQLRDGRNVKLATVQKVRDVMLRHEHAAAAV